MKKILFTLFIAFLTTNFVNAAEVTNKDVEKFISNMVKESQQILSNKNLTEKQKEAEYKKFTESIVDTKWVARFILGSHWRDLTPDQKAEFQTLYKEYLLENYMPKLKDYNKDLAVKKVEKQKDRVYMVSTITKDANGRDVKVDFRVIEKNGNLFLTDIIPEGISFIGSQRSDVNSSITQQGYDKFIEELKGKISKK